jgi:hypothetical protein
MTGADIVGERLREHAQLLAIVPVAKIMGGRLGLVAAPAILVRTISSVDLDALKLTGTKRIVDRVSVTVRARDYDEQIRLIIMIGEIAADRIPAIGGTTDASIRSAGRGPDLEGPGDSFEQAQDFRVTFIRPAS